MERTDGYISMVNQKYFPLLFSVYFASTILSNAFLLQFSDRSTRIITRSERSAVPQSISDSYKGSARNALNVLALLSLIIPSKGIQAAEGPKKYPIVGPDSIMGPKSHGTSEAPVQNKLRWDCDVALSDRICNYNRNWAEFAGYWMTTSFLKETDPSTVTTFYDSVTGKPLFRAPIGRSFEDWKAESLSHGWPSFRDNEVVWENVRTLKNGETVSLTGTHLGHNLPDRKGNRYCINIVSVAGFPSNDVV